MPRPMAKKGVFASKPKNLKGTLGRLVSYLKPHRGKMVLVFVCILLTTMSNVAGTAILSPLFKGLAAGKKKPPFFF